MINSRIRHQMKSDHVYNVCKSSVLLITVQKPNSSPILNGRPRVFRSLHVNHEDSKDKEEAGHCKADTVDSCKSNIILALDYSTVTRHQLCQISATLT